MGDTAVSALVVQELVHFTFI